MIKDAPFVIEKSDGQFEGFCIDILNDVAKEMNFKYKLYKNLIFKGKKNKICKRFILHQIIKLNNFLY